MSEAHKKTAAKLRKKPTHSHGTKDEELTPDQLEAREKRREYSKKRSSRKLWQSNKGQKVLAMVCAAIEYVPKKFDPLLDELDRRLRVEKKEKLADALPETFGMTEAEHQDMKEATIELVDWAAPEAAQALHPLPGFLLSLGLYTLPVAWSIRETMRLLEETEDPPPVLEDGDPKEPA